jgi:hypothetical protein
MRRLGLTGVVVVGLTLLFLLSSLGFPGSAPSVASPSRESPNALASRVAAPASAPGSSTHVSLVRPSGTPTFVVLTGANTTNSYVGTTVTGSGTGFAASSITTVTWSGGTVCSNQTLANGSFSCTWNTPYGPEGPHLFTATDAAHDSASATFSIYSDLSDEFFNGSAAAGGLVEIMGNGFGASVTVQTSWTVGDACSGLSNASGSFACNYTMPLVALGDYYFSAVDTLDNHASASLFYVVGGSISAQPASATVGGSVTITGSNFGPDAKFSVNWTEGVFCQGVTTGYGDLSCSTTVPSAPLGNYSLTATDVFGNAGSTNLTILAKIVPALYVVTFHESGLPEGFSWSVLFNGSSNRSNTTSLQFSEPNGTYAYSVAAILNWTPQPTTGNFTVLDQGGLVPLAFFFTYRLTFDRPNGTPLDRMWTVSLSGGSVLSEVAQPAAQATRSTAGPSLYFDEPNGSYSYTVTIDGETNYSGTGTTTVAGHGPTVTPPPTASSATPPSNSTPSSSTSSGNWLSGDLLYLLLALVVVVVVVVAVLIARRRRATPPPPGPP